jgi:uncharacterized Zn-binding protein involved in type VI secretion
MPGICRDTTDTAGAELIKTQTKVFANGDEVIVHGDTVTAHLAGLHAVPPTMIAGSKNVFIGGIAVCNAGDLATCGHAASGSSDVNVGD